MRRIVICIAACLMAGCSSQVLDRTLSHTVARYRTAYSDVEIKDIQTKIQAISFPVEMEAMIRRLGIPITSFMGQYTKVDDGAFQWSVFDAWHKKYRIKYKLRAGYDYTGPMMVYDLNIQEK
jgi:hypothetical protein